MAIDPEKLLKEMELKRNTESRKSESDELLEHVYDTLMMKQNKKKKE